MKTFLSNVRFWLYTKVSHPLRVRLMNLSWLPLWWMRKHVPPTYRQWTPAATIRCLVERLAYTEQKNATYLKSWADTEQQLRAERMARVADKMSPQQKKWAEDKMGVRFKGGEEN